MKKFGLIILLLITGFYLLLTGDATASHCGSGDYDCQIAEIQREIDALSPAHENNKQELTNINSQIVNLKTRIANISSQLDEIELEINSREEDLSFTKSVFEKKAHDYYKFLRNYDPLLPFLSTESASDAFIEISLRQRAIDGDRQTMDKYASELIALNNDKEQLEQNQTSLASAQSSLNGRANFLSDEIDKVESYMATLSSKQEELLALKAGGFSTSIGDTPATLEPCSGPPGSTNFCNPGFAPAFAAFSFGAPHRVGMSQYGAYGRSKSGQSAETILAAYYQGSELQKGYPATQNITVSGIGTVSLEDNYLLGIYEVPESWGDKGGFEALKAQAVAARTYALYYTNNGAKPICTTESCQVYKPSLKSGKWAEAVRATRGWVITKGGQLVGTYYASTSGGYTISQWGWSGIKDASGAWPDTAYEKVAGSPWFYKGWYRSRGGEACGQSNPWLKSEQMADVVNAWHVLNRGGGDVSRVSPEGACWGGNPYSKGELSSIGGYTGVSNISVVYSNEGYTQTVNVNTNKGSVAIPGSEFKEAFNLRAPGYIGIKSSLFNVESM